MHLLTALHQALRSLARRPGFAAVAILTLGAGIAATTAIYSVVDATLLEPLPFDAPDELVTIDARASTGFLVSLSIPNYRDWHDRQRVFSALGAAAGMGLRWEGDGPPEILQGRAVLGEFFEALGVRPLLGRLIRGAPAGPGAPPEAVLSHAYWRRALGGDSGVVGQSLTLNARPFTIVGVLPPEFGWPTPATDIYFPMAVRSDLPWDDRSSGFGTRAIARLAPGMTLEAAQADLDRVDREIRAEVGDENVVTPEVRSFREFYLGDVTAPIRVLMAGVVCVLLIAVANVSNLQLARGEDRRRELAVRTALGASRAVLIRQLMLESLVLAGAAGVLGGALAWAGVRLLIPLLPEGIPPILLERIAVDPSVLAFTVAATLIAGVLFGIVPALRASAIRPVEGIRAGGTATVRSGFRAGLVVTEVALALVLLIGAGLMARSFDQLRSVDKGFTSEGVLTARLRMPVSGYDTEASWLGMTEGLLNRLRRLPGARDAAVTLLLPLSGRSWERRAIPEGVPFDEADEYSFLFGVVSPGYFSTLGVEIVEGRAFTEADRSGTVPVTIIDERMAETFWPGRSPIGQRVFVGEPDPAARGDAHAPLYRTVVGVAKNVRHYELASPSRMQAYIPHAQAYRLWGVGTYAIVRTTVPPAGLAGALRQAVAGVAPGVALTDVEPLTAHVNRELGSSLAMGRLFGAFGLTALALAALGVFGVVSYAVVRRTREIGIRMALGADAPRVLRQVLGGALTLVGLGITIGLVAAAGLSRLVQGLLFGVAPIEPMTYLLLAGVLLAVAMAAAAVPARRATAVNPVTVLKDE